MKWKLGALVVVIAAIVVYNLPYFEEMRAFNDVKEGNTLYDCNMYLKEYPEGRHFDEVMYMRISLSENDMSMIVEYLEKCPNGAFYTEVDNLCNELWDKEINKYNQRDKSKESPDAVKFMTEMLQYMKEHRINSILVKIKSTLNLKDYSEYDPTTRRLLEVMNNDPLSIEDGMISLKSNFTSEDNYTLTRILVSGVQRSINQMFTPDFISVISWDDENANASSPCFYFEYTINSQEETFGSITIPHIWTYTINDVIENYLIGISIDFNSKFTIPQSSTTFSYAEKGEPSENINNISDIKDGYRQMTSICFAQFSNKMAQNLGLAEAYFQ